MALMSISDRKLGIVIIAAGNSSRLGQPKQLVPFRGKTLLQRCIDLAENITTQITCVLGYQADSFKNSVESTKTKFIINKNWHQGMGTSISIGVDSYKQLDGLMVILCDQYLIDLADLRKLVSQWKKEPSKIIASQYFDIKKEQFIEGAPAVFPSKYFDQLLALKEKGARDLIKNNSADVVKILLKNAAIDLDTKSDLLNLQIGDKP